MEAHGGHLFFRFHAPVSLSLSTKLQIYRFVGSIHHPKAKDGGFIIQKCASGFSRESPAMNVRRTLDWGFKQSRRHDDNTRKLGVSACDPG